MKIKSLTTIILFITIAVSVSAQTKEKGFVIEANISYADVNNQHYATIIPAVAYQFDSRWAAGVKVGFETRDYSYTIYTPFVRFNFLKFSKLNVFAEAQFNIFDRNVEGGQSGYYEAGLSFGATYNLTKHINLVGHYLFLGYSEKEPKQGVWAGDNFGIDGNISRLQVGLQVVF